jgi:hypothetical protein
VPEEHGVGSSILSRGTTKYYMVKNILLKSLYYILDKTKFATVPDMFGDTQYQAYCQMNELSIKSFNTHLHGDWELQYLQGSLPSLQESFIYTFEQTYKIWSSYPCNILYVDPDVFCFKDIKIFDQNYASCFNGRTCGVRYFPHNMPIKSWNIALKAVKKWNYEKYDYEQEQVYRRMNIKGKKINSRLVQDLPFEEFSKIDNTKSMIHLHSSRDPVRVLNLMKKLEQQFLSV